MLRLLLTLALLSSPLYAETLAGQIIGINDGDTATLLTNDRKPIKIRLGQIDAPEKEQAFGEKSKQALSDLIYGKNVTVEVETKDQYGRTVGKVFVGGKDVNLEQIKQGMAWFYVEFGRDIAYRDAESKAKAAKIGLWAEAAPTPPWKWRYSPKPLKAAQPVTKQSALPSTSNPAAKPSIAAPNNRCDGREYCSQMSSCAEAKYFLNHCPNVKMDGNNDGIPCEKQWCK